MEERIRVRKRSGIVLAAGHVLGARRDLKTRTRTGRPDRKLRGKRDQETVMAGLEIHFFGGSKLLLPSSRPGSKTNFVVANLYVGPTFLRRGRLGLCR